MRCPHCDAANRPGARFCRKCGQTLSHPASEEPGPSEGVQAACPHCGAEVRAAASFSPQCGESLVPPAVPSDSPLRPPAPEELPPVPKAVPRSPTPSQPPPRRGAVRVLLLVLVGMLTLLFLGSITLAVLILLDPKESAAEVTPAPTVTGETDREPLPSPEETCAPRRDFAVGIAPAHPEADPRVRERVTVRVTLFDKRAAPILPPGLSMAKELGEIPVPSPTGERGERLTYPRFRTGEYAGVHLQDHERRRGGPPGGRAPESGERTTLYGAGIVLHDLYHPPKEQ